MVMEIYFNIYRRYTYILSHRAAVRIQYFIIVVCVPIQVQHYIMTVQAQDTGKPMLSSTVTVYVNVIDENDNTPVFETNNYNVDIYENATVNTIVATVIATDRDSGKHNIILTATGVYFDISILEMYILKFAAAT